MFYAVHDVHVTLVVKVLPVAVTGFATDRPGNRVTVFVTLGCLSGTFVAESRRGEDRQDHGCKKTNTHKKRGDR